MKDFDASKYFSARKSMRNNDRVTHFAVAATKLAIEDAGVDVAACGERCGVMVSFVEPRGGWWLCLSNCVRRSSELGWS